MQMVSIYNCWYKSFTSAIDMSQSCRTYPTTVLWSKSRIDFQGITPPCHGLCGSTHSNHTAFLVFCHPLVQSDQGGPVVLRLNGRATVVGVYSHQVYPANSSIYEPCDPRHLTVAVNVAYHLDWIQSNLDVTTSTTSKMNFYWHRAGSCSRSCLVDSFTISRTYSWWSGHLDRLTFMIAARM